MILTYRYRLLPSKLQHEALARLCEEQRILYNAALEERIGCYRATGKSRSYIDQCKALTTCRQTLPEMAAAPVNLQRWTLRRLDDAYKAFFRRVKMRNGKAGFPRFRGKHWWDSFGFNEFCGIRFHGKRLRFAGLPGGLRVHLHRPLPDEADIRSCVFRRSGRMWHVCLQLSLPAVAGGAADNVIHQDERRPDHLASAGETLPRCVEHGTHNLASARESLPCPNVYAMRFPRDKPARAGESLPLGIDLGLNVFAYCSDGTTIPNPKIGRKAAKLLRVRQRALARCRRGSKRRQKMRIKLAAAHRLIGNTRDTWLHQQSAALVRSHEGIFAEDLNIQGLMRSAKGTAAEPGTNVRAKSGLNRAIADASWAKFLGMIAYKAERAGKRFIKVNPRNTSQRCSGCSELVRKSLAVRTHCCPHCGLVIDRDWNASLNILRAGLLAGWST